jgi:glycosyltransferase involved in cell wall biosynthesis
MVPDKLPERASNEQFTIAFAGRLEQDQKRVLDLVEIGVALKSSGVNFKVNIAGSGPDERVLREELKIKGLTNFFHFLGNIEPTAMGALLYQESNALLLTSSWETGPIVAWEAMAAGVPIVTSRYLGIESESLLFDRRNCLIFDVGDCGSAARQLELLALDRQLSECLRRSAFSTVSAELTKDISVAQWVQVLTLAMEGEPASGSAHYLPQYLQSAGRLDRWLGPSLAETMRSLRRPAIDAGPAGEWPHTLGGRTISDDEFWRKAERLDQAAGRLVRP